MKRPRIDDIKETGDRATLEYIFQLHQYASTLEGYIKELRLAVKYAQEVIETDIPNFETVLAKTRLED